MSTIRYCTNCNSYTLEEICPRCGKETIIKKPARFSPQDNYGKYRVALKKIDKER